MITHGEWSTANETWSLCPTFAFGLEPRGLVIPHAELMLSFCTETHTDLKCNYAWHILPMYSQPSHRLQVGLYHVMLMDFHSKWNSYNGRYLFRSHVSLPELMYSYLKLSSRIALAQMGHLPATKWRAQINHRSIRRGAYVYIYTTWGAHVNNTTFRR